MLHNADSQGVDLRASENGWRQDRGALVSSVFPYFVRLTVADVTARLKSRLAGCTPLRRAVMALPADLQSIFDSIAERAGNGGEPDFLGDDGAAPWELLDNLGCWDCSPSPVASGQLGEGCGSGGDSRGISPLLHGADVDLGPWRCLDDNHKPVCQLCTPPPLSRSESSYHLDRRQGAHAVGSCRSWGPSQLIENATVRKCYRRFLLICSLPAPPFAIGWFCRDFGCMRRWGKNASETDHLFA